jgi:hypothetical protein
MPNGSMLKPDRVVSVLAQATSLAARQMIINTRVTARPTSITISFRLGIAGPAFVALYRRTGADPTADTVPSRQLRGGWAQSSASGRYELSFTDLDQGVQYWYRITALDPRPPAQKDPASPVTVVGGSATLKRTATVSVDRLRVWMDGDRGSPGEMQFWAGLYDGVGRGIISDPLFYPSSGFASIDDKENRSILNPFGAPVDLDPAPDSLAIFAYVVEDDRWDILPAGFLPVGTPVALPTSSLFFESESYDIAELRQSFRLADTEGTQEIPFEIFSALGKLTFSLRGKITSTVVRLLADVGLQRSAVPSTGVKRAATGLLDARPIFVTAGKTLVTFTLDPDGHIYRQRKNARSMSDVQLIGDTPVRALVAVANDEDLIDVIGMAERGGLVHARFAADDRSVPVWKELRVELAEEPSVIHARDGSLHLFGRDPNGALMHGSVAPDGGEAGDWQRLGEGFIGRAAAAGPVGDSVHLFVRRQGKGIAHGLVSLRRGEANAVRWDDLSAPFEGSILAARVDDGAVVALGWDEHDVVWYKAWEKDRIDPAGPDWERLGTSEEIFAAVERHAPALRLPSTR